VLGLVVLVALLAAGAWFVHNRRSQTYKSASHRNSYNMELMQSGYPQV
jgi:FtsZ-interacting cell division protein ZipA